VSWRASEDDAVGGEVGEIRGVFCAKTAKRQAMDGESPTVPRNQGTYASCALKDLFKGL
jgi:hypothetical protein